MFAAPVTPNSTGESLHVHFHQSVRAGIGAGIQGVQRRAPPRREDFVTSSYSAANPPFFQSFCRSLPGPSVKWGLFWVSVEVTLLDFARTV